MSASVITEIYFSLYLASGYLTKTADLRHKEETLKRQLLLHQLATVHYDYQTNTSIRVHLLQSDYNCEINNYILSIKLQEIN